MPNYTPSAFIPTAPRTGDADRGIVYRGKNVWIRGAGERFYAEVYQGSRNLNETIPTAALTGTVSINAGSKNLLGSGTNFLDQLHPGQFILAGGELLVIDEILSATTATVWRAATANVAAVAAHRLPVIFELDSKRGTLLRGNATYGEQGTIIALGDGTLRLNGQPLAGQSLDASRQAKIAVYNPTTGSYTVYTLGFSAPAGQTATNVAGGTRGMTAGRRSLRLCKGRKATNGFGNPGEPLKFTLAAGEKIKISGVTFDNAEGQDVFHIFSTAFENSTSINPDEGPWYRDRTITAADAPGGIYEFEYLNSELGTEKVTINNDAPYDAEFVHSLIGSPIFVSCQGKGHAGKPNGTSPGPFIQPAKPNNIEAAPRGHPNVVSTSPVEDILGALPVSARLFLMTRNRLNFASFTGNPAFPVTIRPFWKRGFANPFNLTVVDEYLYAATTQGFTRAAHEGDGNLGPDDFSEKVTEFVAGWNLGHTLSAHDPKNEAVVFFYSGAYKNAAGFWVTIALPFLWRQGFWNPPIVIESGQRDMIVSGVVTINGYLEFLAGGRKADGTIQVDTFRFDEGNQPGETAEVVSWQIAWQFSDDGDDRLAKIVKGLSLTAKTTNASFGIFGSRSGSLIDTDALEKGSNFALFSQPIPNSAEITVSEWKKFVVRELLLYTVAVEGVWNGAGVKDRVDEVNLYVEKGGLRK
jgi:hypothetical protein